MPKEVVINLLEPANECSYLVQLLNTTFNILPIPRNELMTLVYLVSEQLSNEEIESTIEAHLGAHVENITINE